MGMGRYPDKTIAELFASNRPYFDQVLYKNVKFRHDYAQAFQRWANEQIDLDGNNGKLSLNRVLMAVEAIGQDRTRELFLKLIKALNEEWPNRKLPEDLDYKTTLGSGGYFERLEGYGPQQKQVQLFWKRIALPELWEE
ncbi:hypothetical protein [Desulfosporosinus sp. Sb-LF]|uniref:hypothetical protein n=1 Tax=Desulfosporosinus sp. Sb-LF TaxID=2560027 RepID=UPI0011045F82|nr:hypothetical protein [Desulfosporosinus sp. Sb-LF]TGE31114.1 hypothetical protein E4K68_18930 [Desulfosporosinus sp. Sb-LF]